MRHGIVRAIAGLLAVVVGCGSDFDPPWRVTGLRVLALRAAAPYAAPGATVHLDALAFDPAGRPLTWGWGTCEDTASFDVLECIDAMDASRFTTAVGQTAYDVTMPADIVARLPDAGKSKASVGVVAVACPGTLTLAVPAPHVRDVGRLPFTCLEAGTGRALGTDEYVAGVKRIFARAADGNANPIIDRITWDGADWSDADVKEARPCASGGDRYDACDDALKHRVRVDVAPSSAESGVDAFGLPFDEQLIVEYFTTEGILENGIRIARASETGWVARTAAANSTVTLWMVVRDDRGGVTWATRKVHVGGP